MKKVKLTLVFAAFTLAVGAAYATRNSSSSITAYHQLDDNPSACKQVGICLTSGPFTCVIQGKQAFGLNQAGTQCIVSLRRDVQ
jgi:hypothetical protein